MQETLQKAKGTPRTRGRMEVQPKQGVEEADEISRRPSRPKADDFLLAMAKEFRAR